MTYLCNSRYRIAAYTLTVSILAGAWSSLYAADYRDVLKQSWGMHLQNQLESTGRKQETLTWYAAMMLERDPFDERALSILVREYEQSGEAVFAGALALYAAHIGITNRMIMPAEYRKKVPIYFQDTDADVIKQGQLDTMDKLLKDQATPEGFLDIYHVDKQLHQLLKSRGTNRGVLLRLGEAYHQQLRYTTSYVTLHLLLYLFPDDWFAVDLQIRNLQRIQQPDLDQRFLRQYARYPGDIPLPYLPAMLKRTLDLNLEPEAMTFARKWAAVDRENGMAWQQFGLLLNQAGDKEQALKAMTQASTLEGHTPDLYVTLARRYAEQDDVQSVMLWLEKYRATTDEEGFIKVLMLSEFKRHPRILKELSP